MNVESRSDRKVTVLVYRVRPGLLRITVPVLVYTPGSRLGKISLLILVYTLGRFHATFPLLRPLTI